MWEEVVRLRKRVEALTRANERKNAMIIALELELWRKNVALGRALDDVSELDRARAHQQIDWPKHDDPVLVALRRSEERRFYFMQENEQLRKGLDVPVPDPWFEV